MFQKCTKKNILNSERLTWKDIFKCSFCFCSRQVIIFWAWQPFSFEIPSVFLQLSTFYNLSTLYYPFYRFSLKRSGSYNFSSNSYAFWGLFCYHQWRSTRRRFHFANLDFNIPRLFFAKPLHWLQFYHQSSVSVWIQPNIGDWLSDQSGIFQIC